MSEDKKQLFLEQVKEWIKPHPGENHPYYRPFIANEYHDRWPVFLVGTNPATPINPSQIDADTYANMLLNQELFIKHYIKLRQRLKKTKVSPTRTGIRKMADKIQKSTGYSVLETNVIPYPASNEKELAYVSKEALNHSRKIFSKLLLNQRPRLIITHGRTAKDELIASLKNHPNIILLQHPPNVIEMREAQHRTPLYELQYADGTKASVFACMHLSKYNFYQKDFDQFIDRVNRYMNGTNKAETTERGLIHLTGETMTAIFDCAYGINIRLEPETQNFLSDQNFRAFVNMLLSMQDYNYRHRNDEVRKLFPLFEKAIGPMERNSEGTTLWLALGLAIKELYGLRVSTFETLLRSLNKY